MAETNFSASPFSIPPHNPPDLRSQDLDTSTSPIYQPSFTNYGSFSPYEPYNQYPDPFRSQLPDPNRTTYPYPQQNRYHQYSFHGGSRLSGYYPPPAGMFQHGPNAAASSGVAPGHYRSLHMSSSFYSEPTESRTDPDPTSTPPMLSGAQNYNLPPYSQLHPPSLPGFNPFLNQHLGLLIPNGPNPTSGHFGSDAMQVSNEGRGPMRGSNTRNSNQPRHVTSPSHRTSYERQHQHHSNRPGETNRRSSSFLSPPNRRSDRSVSPRTSNRRSFDRYSTDLPRSSISSDPDEATRTAALRARRQRVIAGIGYRSRVPIPDHPNTPTEGQIQALKDKLWHYLPNELPKGTSPCCDICQKDYSEKRVFPSEEEEMAIKLPCPANHIFGEFCILQWFETCKKHKNKITCPMCRALLIEPMRNSASPLGVPSFYDRMFIQDSLIHRELESGLAHF